MWIPHETQLGTYIWKHHPSDLTIPAKFRFVDKSKATCHNCGGVGHFKSKCTSDPRPRAISSLARYRVVDMSKTTRCGRRSPDSTRSTARTPRPALQLPTPAQVTSVPALVSPVSHAAADLHLPTHAQVTSVPALVSPISHAAAVLHLPTPAQVTSVPALVSPISHAAADLHLPTPTQDTTVPALPPPAVHAFSLIPSIILPRRSAPTLALLINPRCRCHRTHRLRRIGIG